jgi:hypothetical protein
MIAWSTMFRAVPLKSVTFEVYLNKVIIKENLNDCFDLNETTARKTGYTATSLKQSPYM